MEKGAGTVAAFPPFPVPAWLCAPSRPQQQPDDETYDQRKNHSVFGRCRRKKPGTTRPRFRQPFCLLKRKPVLLCYPGGGYFMPVAGDPSRRDGRGGQNGGGHAIAAVVFCAGGAVCVGGPRKALRRTDDEPFRKVFVFRIYGKRVGKQGVPRNILAYSLFLIASRYRRTAARV